MNEDCVVLRTNFSYCNKIKMLYRKIQCYKPIKFKFLHKCLRRFMLSFYANVYRTVSQNTVFKKKKNSFWCADN